MRMEELSDSRYIKSTDTVERYLLNLVQEYFKNTNVASATSREYIIKKAVERMKEEITFDNIGVLSITLPNGEMKTGAVSISLEDLNGEPLISPKLTAFNVNFGRKENTACEGNDPRLSDARKPLKHTHKVSDITGLEGTLSTLAGKINKVNSLVHNHKNKSLLDILVYTGDKTTIDLSKLDTIENKVTEIVEQIHDDITTYEKNINSKTQAVNKDINDIRNQISDLSKQATSTSKSYYTQAKEYIDSKFTNLHLLVSDEIDKLATKDDIADIVDIVSNANTLVGSMSFNLNSVINTSLSSSSHTVDVPIDASIITELSNRAQTLSDCQIEAIIEYTDSSGQKQCSYLPYIIFEDYIFDGMLQVATRFTTQKIHITLDVSSGVIPDLLKESIITYSVYSKKTVVL